MCVCVWCVWGGGGGGSPPSDFPLKWRTRFFFRLHLFFFYLFFSEWGWWVLLFGGVGVVGGVGGGGVRGCQSIIHISLKLRHRCSFPFRPLMFRSKAEKNCVLMKIKSKKILNDGVIGQK